jgi:hypothetical protein
VFAIVDMVSRKWIDTLVSVEESATQVPVIFEHALELEGLLGLLTDERLDLAVDSKWIRWGGGVRGLGRE